MNNPRRIQRHLVKALAAGSVLVAAALPLAISGVASAATAPTLTAIAFTPHGATTNATGADVAAGTATFTGSGFANNGATNNTLVATCSAGTLVFSSVAETSATTGTASFASTGTAAATCDVVLTDANGVATSVTDAANLDATPVISTISPSSVWEASAPTTVTITGTGFVTGATVAITHSVDGTALTSSVTSVSATSIVLSVTPTNPSGGGAATPGAFDVVVSNTDGGSSNTGTFTVGNGLENASPSAESAIGSYTVALLGSGFQYGATVSLSTYSTPGVAGGTYTADAGACLADITTSTLSGISDALATTITSPTAGTITVPITAVTAADCALTLTNTGAGNNGIGYTLAGAFGVGEASTVAPVITASNATTPITVGSAATTVTLTGSGFSIYSTVGAAPATDVAYTAANGAAGTTLTFNATVSSGVTAGAVPVTVTNGASTTFTPAITVAGPAITSQAPNLVVGAPIGATVVLTGTGFTNTTSGTASGAGMTGTVSYASATTLNLVVTGSPTGTTGGVVNVSTVTGLGTVNAATFSLTIDAPPLVVSAVTYAVGAGSDVGVGATAATVRIHGTGFLPGATVTAFVNGAGVADPNVTATVTAVTSTQITATVAIKGPDTNTAVGYTVTNTDGGAVKVAAFAYPIFIGAGPTITAVSPTPVLAASTNAITITGTGFETGVVASATSNATCGPTTVVSATSITVSCTFGIAQTTPSSLVVTNPDGGSATSAVVLPAITVPPKKPAFHVSGVHGSAVAGRTVTLTISGTGFYGQPHVTSNAAGTRARVTKDNGKLLTVRVTTRAGTKARSYTFTVSLANGKSGKANYSVKK